MNDSIVNTYSLNPQFIPIFLERFTDVSNKIFLALLLLVCVENEFEIDVTSLSDFLVLPESYCSQALLFYIEHQILLVNHHIDSSPLVADVASPES